MRGRAKRRYERFPINYFSSHQRIETIVFNQSGKERKGSFLLRQQGVGQQNIGFFFQQIESVEKPGKKLHNV